jgi:hypothetical protein
VLKDLHRTYDEKGNFALSYSPLDQTQVYNASLLGGRLLSRIYQYTGETLLRNEAGKIVAFVCERQNADGSWTYGTLPYHQWIDNFHTGFNLECIHEYGLYTGDTQFEKTVDRGFNFYINNFFEEDGASKYYHNRLYPVDIHSPAQLTVTVSKLNRLHEQKQLAEKVLLWTIRNMQDANGYFYYQKKKWLSSRIPYMRWAQAWMFYAMSYYLVSETATDEKPDQSTRHTH